MDNPYCDIIQRIESLPLTRDFTCGQCGHTQPVYRLTFHHTCPKCGTQQKLRGDDPYGCELEDVIDAVLLWMGQGEAMEQAMARKALIEAEPEDG